MRDESASRTGGGTRPEDDCKTGHNKVEPTSASRQQAREAGAHSAKHQTVRFGAVSTMLLVLNIAVGHKGRRQRGAHLRLLKVETVVARFALSSPAPEVAGVVVSLHHREKQYKL